MSSERLTGCRVLVVEDEYFLANDLEKVLKSHCATVVGPIDDLGEALFKAERNGLDVAILDINIRDELAYPIADELNRLRIPFVFYTGYDDKVIPEHFAEVRRWHKPEEPRGLIDHIEQIWKRGSSVG